MTRPFLTTQWRHLVMLNFEIDPARLLPFIPLGTELDFFGGKTFISLVGFLFLRTRVLGIPVPFHQNFEEVNLRFYVRRHAPEGWRRGVVFIKEIVPKAAVAWIARRVYNENYVACRMRSRIELPDPCRSISGVAEYGWECASQRNSMRAEFAGNPSPAGLGSEEEFITEHYWGFTRQRDGGTIEYHVDHPPWRVWRASPVQLTCDVAGCYGVPFVEPLARPPTSAFVADGSTVTVDRGEHIGG